MDEQIAFVMAETVAGNRDEQVGYQELIFSFPYRIFSRAQAEQLGLIRPFKCWVDWAMKSKIRFN